MKLLNAALSAGLLFSLVSCGGDSNGSSKRGPAVDQLVTSADWKILLEGRSFPNKAMVTVNDEVVVNECADKQTFFINRESNPQTLPMANYLVPTADSVKIEITDMGENCDAESSFFSGTDVPYEMTKDGAHAEVIVRL
ncbi:MAG: hypothetical protein V4598_01155 [Bdellovibrionota bacterium]